MTRSEWSVNPKFHVAGLLAGSVVLSAVALYARYGEAVRSVSYYQDRDLIQLLANAALIFIPAFVVLHWKGKRAGYLSMFFIAALMIVEHWPRWNR